MAKVINVEGIIGAGKTTLVDTLSRDYEVETVPEPVDDNPFLAKFYDDEKAYGYLIQMWLLSARHDANRAAFWLARGGRNILVDRGRLGDRCFARVNNALGNITDDQMMVYDKFFTSMNSRDPDAIVFIDIGVTEAGRRIEARGRECEKGIDPHYLHLLRLEHDHMVNDASQRGVEVIRPTGDYSSADVARALNLTARSA